MRKKSKFTAGAFLFLAMVALGAGRPSAQTENSLRFLTKIFSSEGENEAASVKNGRPEIVFFARIFDTGLGRDAAQQLESLKKFFRLDHLEMKAESSEIEISWGESWEERKKAHPEVMQSVIMNGEEYVLRLIPEEIDRKGKVYKFRLDIHKNQAGADSSALKTTELILSKEILWNFGGPLAVGFYFGDKAYFITYTIWYQHSAFAGSMGVGFSEIL